MRGAVLPEGWAWCEAQECMDVRDGTHDSPKYIPAGYPLVTSKNLVNGNIDFSTCSFISKADHDAISRRSAVDDGDILYAMIGTIGNPVIVKKQFEFSIKNVALFKFDDASVFNRYIYYFLNGSIAKQQFAANSRGGTQKFVSLTNIRKLKIPLPPLAEQQKIAAILDAADSLRQKDQQLIDHYTTLSQSLFLDMFGDPVTNSMGWEKCLLADNVNKITKGGSPKWQGFEYTEAGVKFITSENVLTNKISLEKKKFIPDEFDQKLNNSQLEVGDILLNIVGASAGRAAKVFKEHLPANINQAVAKIALLPSSRLNRDFLMRLLNEPHFNKVLLGDAVESARLNLSLGGLKKLNIISPPIELQNQFAERIQAIEAQKQQAQASLDKSNDLFNSLLQRAFSGELTGSKAA